MDTNNYSFETETSKPLLNGLHLEYHAGSLKEEKKYRNGTPYGLHKSYKVITTIEYSPTILIDGIETVHSKTQTKNESRLVRKAFNLDGKKNGQQLDYQVIIPQIISCSQIRGDHTNTKVETVKHEDVTNSGDEKMTFSPKAIDRLDYSNSETEKSALKTDITIGQLECSDKSWNYIPVKSAISHFKILIEKKSKNGKPFLTEKQFINFIQRSFLSKSEIPKEHINLVGGEKGFVIKRFYEFYTLAISQHSLSNKKIKFIKLLSDNFTNWEYDKITCFFKPGKSKENW